MWVRILERCALVAAALILQLLFAEAVLRFAWRESETAITETGETTRSANFADLTRPNFRGAAWGLPYRNNSRGLRGPEWSPAPRPGVFRVMVAGDSVTNGSGVVEADRYTSQLEQILNEGDGDPRYEVLNAGLAGLNIGHVMNRLERALSYYRGHLLVYGFTLNDIEGERYRDSGAMTNVRRWHSWAQKNADSPIYSWRFLSQRIYELQTRSDRARMQQELRENYTSNPNAWSDFLAGLDRFAAIAGREGVCGLVLLHTALGKLDADHPFTGIYDRVAASATERSLRVAQSFPYYEGLRAEALRVSRLDPHPNRQGHEILARALASRLRDLPAECWDRPHERP